MNKFSQCKQHGSERGYKNHGQQYKRFADIQIGGQVAASQEQVKAGNKRKVVDGRDLYDNKGSGKAQQSSGNKQKQNLLKQDLF